MTDLFYLLKFQHHCGIVMGAARSIQFLAQAIIKKTVIECIC